MKFKLFLEKSKLSHKNPNFSKQSIENFFPKDGNFSWNYLASGLGLETGNGAIEVGFGEAARERIANVDEDVFSAKAASSKGVQ